jgi:hypothetical protein
MVDEESEVDVALRRLRQPTDDLSAVRSALMRAVERPPSLRERLQSLRTPVRAALVTAVAAALAVVVALVSRRPDWSGYPTGRLALELGALALLVAASIVVGLRSAAEPPPTAGRERLLGVALLAFPVVLVMFPAPSAAHLESASYSMAVVAACLAYGGGLGGLVLLATWTLSRGEVGIPLGRAGIAVAGGATGLLLLHLHCPITARAHVLLAHASLPALFAGVALLTVSTRSRAVGRR